MKLCTLEYEPCIVDALKESYCNSEDEHSLNGEAVGAIVLNDCL